MLKHKNLLLLGILFFIILAAGLVSILNRTSSNSTAGDVRARAATANSLELMGTVVSTNDAKGTLLLDTVYLDDESRSGEPQNLGAWTITVPPGFNLASLIEGQKVKVSMEAKSFSVEDHTVSALSIIPVSR